MSWNDYHLNNPSFCTPLPVMRGLVSALCERREAIDSTFHAKCVSSGASAVAESSLSDMLFCESAGEIPFRKIKRESADHVPYAGSSRFFSFMHMFDAFLLKTLDGFAQTAGYAYRFFTDSAGIAEYTSLESLASALSEPLIAPRTIHSAGGFSDGCLQVHLDAAWAVQRTEMLKLLRYVRVRNGGIEVQYAEAKGDLYGSTPQNAYDAIDSWTLSDMEYAGRDTPLECRLEYHCNTWDVPERRWTINDAREISRITPVFDGCPETPDGTLRFNAVDLRQRDGQGNPVNNETTVYPFDPLGAAVSSGANTLLLNSGVFASWGYGAADIGQDGNTEKNTERGWQALNVRIVYDYESVFNFKQEE